MKSFVRRFLLAGVSFGLYWGIYFGRETGIWSALSSGIIAGTLAGFVVATVARFRENMVLKSTPALIDEILLRDTRASHDGMSGRLCLSDCRVFFEGYLTDERAPEITTLFEGNAAQEPPHQVSIPILCISDVTASQKLGVMSWLKVTRTEGRIESFAVENAADWAEEISTARQKYLDQPRSEDRKLFP